MIRTTLVAVAILLAAPAYAQSVRVISGGGIEHVYGPGGQLLDDDALRTRNERAEKELQAKRTERERAARQAEAEAEYERQKALADQAAADYEQIQLFGSPGLLPYGRVRVRQKPRTQYRSTTERPIAPSSGGFKRAEPVDPCAGVCLE